MTFYYVKAGVGSDANNGLNTAGAFLTLSKAAQLMVAGDTTLVLSGNYNAAIFFSGAAYHNGTAANPITMRSITPYAAKIKALGAPATAGGNDAMWELRVNTNYWVLDGFELTASDGYSGGINGGTWTLGGAGQYRDGIVLSGLNQIAQNNYVHHICLADPAGQGGAGIQSEGFYVSYAASNNIIRYNIIHNIASSVTANKAHGIYITGANVYIIGNLVYNQFNGVLVHGWHGMTGGAYVNNTVFNSTNAGLLIGQGDGGAGSGVANFRGFNNIVVDCQIGIVEYGSLPFTNCRWSTNCVWNCNVPYQINAASTAVAKINTSPTFVNYIKTGGGNYHLSQGSVCINTGLASLSGIQSPVIDIDGVIRPSSALWDLGAYEFGTPAIVPSIDTTVTNFFGGHERHFIFHH